MLIKPAPNLYSELDNVELNRPLRSVGDRIVSWFFNLSCVRAVLASTSAPEIVKVVHLGGTHWRIDLPATRESFYCCNEGEVMSWLENRYASR